MNKMPHIQLDDSIGATAAILPGDPARVDAIAAFLTDVKEEGFSREYKSSPAPTKAAAFWPSQQEWEVPQLQSALKNSPTSDFGI